MDDLQRTGTGIAMPHGMIGQTESDIKRFTDAVRLSRAGKHWSAIQRIILMGGIFSASVGCGPRLVDSRPPTPPPIWGTPQQQPPMSGPAFSNAQPMVVPGQESRAVDSATVPTVPGSSLLPDAPTDVRSVYHSVKAGETLSSIARQYETTAKDLAVENGIQLESILQPGQQLFIRNERR